MTPVHQLWIDGKWQESKESRPILSPWDGSKVADVMYGTAGQLEQALSASVTAFQSFRHLSRYTRSRLLTEIASGISARRQMILERMTLEAGKPNALADVEISRAIANFTNAAEEAKRYGGEVVPVDVDEGGRSFSPATVYWVPRGPVIAITPFNFPLNLAVHKVAPALAIGAPVILKPPPQAPGAGTILAEIFREAATKVSDGKESVPLSAFQVLHLSNELASTLVTDERPATLSFTGSDKVGWALKSKAERKQVILELGGNAGVMVHSDADLKRAAARCAYGAFAYAGQICISVQRIVVHQDVAEQFQDLLIQETKKLPVGDPRQKETLIGPLIDSIAADRIENWLNEAKSAGAKIWVGGGRKGNVIEPTILTNVGEKTHLYCDEAFGPVVFLNVYRDEKEGIQKMNDSKYGIQAGIFTQNQKLILKAIQEIEVGGLLVNEVPTYRADPAPYGGMKHSGLGREGVRFAMEAYSDRKTILQWIG